MDTEENIYQDLNHMHPDILKRILRNFLNAVEVDTDTSSDGEKQGEERVPEVRRAEDGNVNIKKHVEDFMGQKISYTQFLERLSLLRGQGIISNLRNQIERTLEETRHGRQHDNSVEQEEGQAGSSSAAMQNDFKYQEPPQLKIITTNVVLQQAINLVLDYEELVRRHRLLMSNFVREKTIRNGEYRENVEIQRQRILLLIERWEGQALLQYQGIQQDFQRGFVQGNCLIRLTQELNRKVQETVDYFVARTNQLCEFFREEADRVVPEAEGVPRDEMFPNVFDAVERQYEVYFYRFAKLKEEFDRLDIFQREREHVWLSELIGDVIVGNRFLQALKFAQEKRAELVDYREHLPEDRFNDMVRWVDGKFGRLNTEFEEGVTAIRRDYDTEVEGKSFYSDENRSAMKRERERLEAFASSWKQGVSIAFMRFRGMVMRRNANFHRDERLQQMVQAQREELAQYHLGMNAEQDEMDGIEGIDEPDRQVIDEIMQEEEENEQGIEEDEDDERMMRRMQGTDKRLPESKQLHLGPNGQHIWTSWDEDQVWLWAEKFLPESVERLRELDFDGVQFFHFLNDPRQWNAKKMPLGWYIKLKANFNRLINHLNMKKEI